MPPNDKVYKISKDNCQYCKMLNFLIQSSPLGKYRENIINVHKEEDEELYSMLTAKAQEQGYMSLPIIMDKDYKVLVAGYDAKKIRDIFEEMFG